MSGTVPPSYVPLPPLRLFRKDTISAQAEISNSLSCVILFSLQTIALPRAEISRLRAASAASIVAAKGRSFRLTRSAFSLSPLATKASLPKGLSDHCRSAFDFRLRRTRHWRGVALCNPSLRILIIVYTVLQSKHSNKGTAPKVSKGRPESPLVAPAGAKSLPLAKQSF